MNFRSFYCGTGLCLAGLLGLSGCTTSDQGAETATGGAPAEVRSDADRRAIYNSGGRTSPVPDATPNRVRLGEQASDINRRKRPETLNTDDPNTTTPETRFDRIEYSAPPDTSRRRP